MSSFAENLARLRNERQITQEELAKRSGVTQGAIWQYENGVTTPRIKIAVALATALGTTCEALLYGDGGKEA